MSIAMHSYADMDAVISSFFAHVTRELINELINKSIILIIKINHVDQRSYIVRYDKIFSILLFGDAKSHCEKRTVHVL